MSPYYRPNHVHHFFTPVSLDLIFTAMCRVPESIDRALIYRCQGKAYQIQRPGQCVHLEVFCTRDSTRLIVKFKAGAATLWKSLKQLLVSFLPGLRRQKDGPPSPPPPKASPPRRKLASVAQLVAKCQTDPLTEGHLVFSDKAIALADRCPFRHVEQTAAVLHKLSLAAGLMRGGLHHGKTPQQFWHECIGLPVTFFLSDTQEHKYGEDYDAIHDGMVVRGRHHVTLGLGNNPATCMSIYWTICEDCQAIIITRCGAHGRTAHS
jgi:hypothetical protein